MTEPISQRDFEIARTIVAHGMPGAPTSRRDVMTNLIAAALCGARVCHGNCPEALGYATGVAAMRGERDNAIRSKDAAYAERDQCIQANAYNVYAVSYTHGSHATRKRLYMHREIMGLGAGRDPQVDHISRDPLDNRRANLRLASNTENGWNQGKLRTRKTTSRFKGVSLALSPKCPSWRRWKAAIRVRGVSIYLGVFVSEETAARAYDEAARIAFGEFACVNFPRPGERCAL